MIPHYFGTLILFVLIVLSDALKPFREEITEVQINDGVDYRLPSGIVPSHYQLTIRPDLDKEVFDFEGNVIITVNVTETRNSITLHSYLLNITAAATRVVSLESGGTIPISTQEYDLVRQFYIINLAQNLTLGEHNITLEFSGKINDEYRGFYRSHYYVDGEKRWIVLTQFASTFARWAFPCFDEPALKATFKIFIYHYLRQSVRSNGRRLDSVLDFGETKIRTDFALTPRMSTYLVAFTVSDFISVRNADNSFLVWLQSSASSTGTYALTQGERQHNALALWMDVEDPMDSFVEQFAAPDFSFGAMENWGLIVYKESLLLQQNRVTSSKDIQSIATIMSHEFAHIWFGNLVTMSWWDYVWLNEGFATYFEYFGTSLIEPDWRMMELFVVEVQQPVLISDSSAIIGAMNGNVDGSPGATMASYNAVAYSKAGSVIRMLSYFIGEDAFQKGLQNYLRNMAEQVASPSDLYPYLQEASDESGLLQVHVDIDEVLSTWTNQPGYPLVTVTRNYASRVLEVSQERFYIDRNSTLANPEGFRWWIPINFATETDLDYFYLTNATSWIRSQDESIMMNRFDPEAWVIFNVQQSGYYRVNYDVTNWNMLINYLLGVNYSKIPPLNRASLLDDSLNLARAGYIDYEIPLNLTKYLVAETDYVPWVSATNGFAFLDRMLNRHEVYPAFQAHVRNLVKPLRQSLTFTEGFFDSHIRKRHRNLMLTWACNTGDDSCRENAISLFNTWVANPVATITANLKSFVYCWGIRAGTENDWNTIWDRYLATDLATEKLELLNSLGCTKNPTIIHRYMNLSISPDSGIRDENRLVVFSSLVVNNPENVDIVFEYIRDNFQLIADQRGYGTLGTMLSSLGNRIVTTDLLEQLRTFLAENTSELGTAAISVQTAITNAEANLAWIEKYSPSIINWLPKYEEEDKDSGSVHLRANMLALFFFVLVSVGNTLT